MRTFMGVLRLFYRKKIMKSFVRSTSNKKVNTAGVGKALLLAALVTVVPTAAVVGGALASAPSASAATYATFGAIGAKYSQLGGPSGGLGQPIGPEINGLPNGGAYQKFERGTIFWTPATGAKFTYGAIGGMYAAAGAQNSALGYPVTDEIGGLRNGGVFQNYQNGSIIWSPATR